MTIDPDSGLIAWTPSVGGAYDVTVTASNSVNTAVQSFVLIVTETAVITSNPITQTSVGQLYNYDVDATGYPTPTYALTTAPTGMSINPNTGLIAWTPGAGGVYSVTVTANNAVGSQNQAFNLMATQTPTIASTPVTEIGINQSYSYDVTATGYPAPTFTLTTAPPGMTIDQNSGLIEWTPDAGGTFTVTVSAKNGVDTAVQTFDITVNEYLIYLPIVLRSGP
jgi:hypothetical protein